MIENAVYQVLTEGAAFFAADLTRLNPVFQPKGVKALVPDAELAKIRTMFESFYSDTRWLRHSFATSPTHVPCYALMMQEDSPKQKVLGFNTGSRYDTAGAPPVLREYETIGTLESNVVRVLTYGVGADQTRYLYRILKYLLLSQVKRLMQLFGQEPDFNGQEWQPIQMGLPQLVYCRALSVSMMVEEEYEQILTDVPIVFRSLDVHRWDGTDGVQGVEGDPT